MSKEQDRHNQIFCERCNWELDDDCDYNELGDLLCSHCIETTKTHPDPNVLYGELNVRRPL